jgi:hypothetical protein
VEGGDSVPFCPLFSGQDGVPLRGERHGNLPGGPVSRSLMQGMLSEPQLWLFLHFPYISKNNNNNDNSYLKFDEASISILQLRNMRLREVKPFAQGHPGGKGIEPGKNHSLMDLTPEPLTSPAFRPYSIERNNCPVSSAQNPALCFGEGRRPGK